MIPLRLTQTWKSHEPPSAAAGLVRGWRERHPGWDCRLYDDAESRALVAEVVPDRLPLYDALPFPVMRADLFRYAAMVRDGGVYADIDMECRRSITPLLDGVSCLLAIEARLGATRTRELGYARPFQIANCVFAAEPGHPFFRAALDRAFGLIAAAPTITRETVEDLTGPRMLTRLFFERAWDDVHLAHPIALMAPLHHPTVAPFDRNVFTRHLTFGSWKGAGTPKSLKRTWIERDRAVWPFPSRLVVSAAEAIGARTGEGAR
ncbi:MAG: glycosyltransferase [Siculibacillus sp.]